MPTVTMTSRSSMDTVRDARVGVSLPGGHTKDFRTSYQTGTHILATRFSALKTLQETYTGYNLADIIIKNVSYTEEQCVLLALGLPQSGFDRFRTFIPGDYTYDDAMLGISLTAPATVGRPAIGNLVWSVDVPDVNEQGTATLTAAWTQINFTKVFTSAPNVAVYQTNTTSLAVGRARNITTTSFEAALFDTTNTLVSGDIAFIASGY